MPSRLWGICCLKRSYFCHTHYFLLDYSKALLLNKYSLLRPLPLCGPRVKP